MCKKGRSEFIYNYSDTHIFTPALHVHSLRALMSFPELQTLHSVWRRCPNDPRMKHSKSTLTTKYWQMLSFFFKCQRKCNSHVHSGGGGVTLKCLHTAHRWRWWRWKHGSMNHQTPVWEAAVHCTILQDTSTFLLPRTSLGVCVKTREVKLSLITEFIDFCNALLIPNQ